MIVLIMHCTIVLNYYMGLIFAISQKSAKATKIGPTKNFKTSHYMVMRILEFWPPYKHAYDVHHVHAVYDACTYMYKLTFKIREEWHHDNHSELLVFGVRSWNSLSEGLGKSILDAVIGQRGDEELVLYTYARV